MGGTPISNAGASPVDSTTFVTKELDTGEVQGRFMRELDLPKGVLQSLSRISSLAAERFSKAASETKTLSDYSVNPERNRVDATDKALNVLRETIEIAATIGQQSVGSTYEISTQERMQAFKKSHDQMVIDLKEFRKDMLLLFDEDPSVLEKLLDLISKITENYDQQVKEGDLSQFEIGENNLATLKESIRNILKTKGEALKAVDGLKYVANLLRGFKVKRLLNEASNTQTLFNTFKASLNEIVKLEESKELDFSKVSGVERREAYRNIKIIQERSYELLSIEKQVKRTFPLSFFTHIKLAKLERTYQEISEIADSYYKKLNFSEDEVNSFRDLSIESHRPCRQHLIMFASDILDGAMRLGEEKRALERQKLCQDYAIQASGVEDDVAKQVFTLVDTNLFLESESARIGGIRGLNPEEVSKRQDRILNNIGDNLERLEKLIAEDNKVSLLIEIYQRQKTQICTPSGWESFIKELQTDSAQLQKISRLQEREELITKFENKVAELSVKAHEHPQIGANRPREYLASDKISLKKQEAEAKKAIQGLFDELKIAYCELTSETDDKDALKIAAKVLNDARNEVLSDKMRWDRPIVRTIEFSGPSASGKLSVEHKLVCLNSGYPSSSFRGRVAGPGCIQPNLQKVEIKNSLGEMIASYTSSATTVEFFQPDAEKRAAATIHQTGEILMGKIDNKFAALKSLGSTQGLGTKENPVTVDVLTTLLLSPDTIRDWLDKENTKVKIGEFTGKWLPKGLAKKFEHAVKIDPSNLERRMLKESLEAWMAFDKSSDMQSIPQELQFKDKDGNTRVMFHEKNESGERVFGLVDAKLDVEGNLEYHKEDAKYVQFDISCYNVGCNKWTKMMTNLSNGKGIETIAKTAINLMNTVFKAKLPEFEGQLGNDVEKDMNTKAFAKDTKRYHAKIEKLKAQKQGILNKAIGKGTAGFSEIKKMEKLISGRLIRARQSLEVAETQYQRAKTSAEAKIFDKERKEAFKEWQQVRYLVANQLDILRKRTDLSLDVQEYLEILEHQQDLDDLFNEIKDQLTFRDYRTDEGMDRNMYSLSSTLVLFGMALDADPHTACRSGKDRTSLQRMEIGTKVLSKEANHRYLNYREIEQNPGTYEIREQMLLNSGHIDDLARLNIGSSGLNLDGAHGSYLKQIERDGTIHSTEYERSVLFGAKGVFSMVLK